jgi:hypothetical protein
MRSYLVAAVLAVSAVSTGSASALTLTGPASVRAGASQGTAESVVLVCRNICNDLGYCRRRCWDRPDYYEGGYRPYAYEPVPRVYYDRPRYYDPGPGIGIYGPGVGIRVGPGW